MMNGFIVIYDFIPEGMVLVFKFDFLDSFVTLQILLALTKLEIQDAINELHDYDNNYDLHHDEHRGNDEHHDNDDAYFHHNDNDDDRRLDGDNDCQ